MEAVTMAYHKMYKQNEVFQTTGFLCEFFVFGIPVLIISFIDNIDNIPCPITDF